MYPLNEKITEAFINSDETYFEIDFNKKLTSDEWIEIDENSKLNQSISIDKILSKENYKLLEESFKEIGIDIKQLYDYKPIYLYMLYSSQLFTQNFSSDLPVDVYLSNSALKQNKNVHELEGIKFQYDILYNLSMDLQVELLKDLGYQVNRF